MTIIIENMELGLQPLDAVMSQQALSNPDLVRISKEHLTHKMVQKGRKGRQLTLNVQNKILSAINAARPEAGLKLKDLFNYKGRV